MSALKSRISLLLNWYTNPYHAPIFVAQQLKFYLQEDIKLAILEPTDPSDVTELVGLGTVDFGVKAMIHTVAAVAKGYAVRSIGTLLDEPPTGLIALKSSGIKIALATSAPSVNVKFTLAKTGLRKYFKIIIDAKGVKRGKPYPDIFLKAAKNLKTKPSRCIIFEDTFHGIEAAKRAGMKVIAVATSHSAKEISHADLVIKDFSQIAMEELSKLI